MDNQHFTINPYITEKFIVFSRQKMASSYLRAQFCKRFDLTTRNNLPWVSLNMLDSFKLVQSYTDVESLEGPLMEYYSTIKKDFGDIINKSCKKDIILLIRNPKTMFLSAWYQDYITPVIDDMGTHSLFQDILSILLHDDTVDDTTVNQFISTITKKSSGRVYNTSDAIHKFFVSDDINKPIVMRSIVFSRMRVLNYLKQSVISEHNQLYLGKYNEFITSEFIDNSKIKIVDLDNPKTPLSSLLNSYESEVFPIQRNNESNGWKEIIHECFNDERYYPYYESLMSQLESEMYYYTKLILMKNYIKEI